MRESSGPLWVRSRPRPATYKGPPSGRVLRIVYIPDPDGEVLFLVT